MANTLTWGSQRLQIVPDGVTDFDIADYLAGNKLRLTSVKFYGSAANDVLIIRDGSATGPIISKMKDVTPSGVADALSSRGGRCRPYISVADQTWNTPANVIVVLEWK